MSEKRWYPRAEILPSVLCYVILFAFLLNAIVPIYWLISSSFKTPLDIRSMPPRWFAFSFTLNNYRLVLSRFGLRPLINSAVVTAGSVILAMIVGTPGAYALARKKNRSVKIVGAAVFGTRFLPTISFVLPIFFVFTRVGLVGTRMGLILAYQVFLLPVVMYTMWSYFLGVPVEIEEAARLDGLSPLQIVFRITLPNARQGLIAAIIMGSIFAWNQFLIAILLGGRQGRVVTVLLQQFSSPAETAAAWGPLYAWTSIISVPVIVLGMVTSVYLLRAFSGSKGD